MKKNKKIPKKIKKVTVCSLDYNQYVHNYKEMLEDMKNEN